MTFAISQGSAERFSASRAIKPSRNSSDETFARFVWIARLGTTAFTRTPTAAPSMAATRVSASTPAFAAE